VTLDVIDEVSRRIAENIHPQKIVLFGSQAKNTPSRHSEIDLLVIVKDQNHLASLKKRERYGEILKLFPHKGFGLDVIVLTEKEIERVAAENEGEWDLILEILKDGKTIYYKCQE